MHYTLSDLGVTRQEKSLSNGARVVHFEKKNAPLVLKVVFKSGSRFDPDQKKGVSHFLEHMLVAGSKDFATKDKLTMFIEREGGGIGATTSHELLYLNGHISEPKKVDVLTKTLGQIIDFPLFNPKTLENERGSIYREIESRVKSARDEAYKRFWEMRFQKTIYEIPILGTKESLANISSEDVRDYYSKYISPNRCVVVSAGGISIDALCESFEKNVLFSNSGLEYIEPEEFPVVRERYKTAVYSDLSDGIDLSFGFRTFPLTHPDCSIAIMLANIMGASRFSILNQKLRYERGLTYGTYAGCFHGRSAGSWQLGYSVAPDKAETAKEIVISLIKDIKSKGVDPNLLAAFKESAVNSIRAEYETSAEWVSDHFNYEYIKPLEGRTTLDSLERYMKVTNEDIIRFANQYMRDDNWYLAAAGKIKEADLPELKF